MATSIGVKLKMDGESEFRKGLNNIISSTKSLDKQMGALESTFKDGKKSMEDNEKQTELLEKKQAALEKQIEEVNKALEYAKDNYEEGSKEISSWEAALADAQKELNQTNQKLDACAEYQANATSAYGQLTTEIDDQTAELEELKDAYVNATLEYGENSEEAQALADQIVDLSAELEENKSRLEEVTAAAENLGTAAEEPKSALQSLTDEINSQQSELDTLRDSYIDAVLQFGETSDEAQALAGQITTLSGELQDNKAKLEGAQEALQGVESAAADATEGIDAVGDELEDTGKGAEELVGKFGGSFMGMAEAIESAGVAGIIGIIVEALIDLGQQAIEALDTVQRASNEMIRSTLLAGEGLVEAENAAYNAYLQMNDTSLSLEKMEAIGGTLYTRLGLTGDALENATLLFGKYSAATGTDGVKAVNDLVDVMRAWGLETDDDTENIRILNDIMDKFTYAQGQGKLSIDDVTNAMKDQSGAWDSIGYSMDDAIALMAGYTDAGGEASEITGAVKKAVQVLAGKTDDMGAAWEEAITIITNADDRFSTLDDTIGETGVTIQTVFGKQAAGKMVDVFKDGKVQSEQYSEALEGVSGQMDDLYSATRTVSDELDAVSKAFGNYEMIMFQNSQAMKQQYEDWQKSSAEATSSMTSDYENMYNELSTPIPLHVTAPVVGYSQSGTTYVPFSGGRYTFAKAYDQAYIMTAPTIFGASGNQMLVGGDRPGNEIVVGEQHLIQLMREAMTSGGVSNDIVMNIYGSEGQDVHELAELIGDELQRIADRRSATYG